MCTLQKWSEPLAHAGTLHEEGHPLVPLFRPCDRIPPKKSNPFPCEVNLLCKHKICSVISLDSTGGVHRESTWFAMENELTVATENACRSQMLVFENDTATHPHMRKSHREWLEEKK